VVNTTEKMVQNIDKSKTNRWLRRSTIDEETIFSENALFKIESSFTLDENKLKNIIKESHSEIVTVARDFCDLKIRRRAEIQELYEKLRT
jgi:acetolactate synthase-1/3 small subunit